MGELYAFKDFAEKNFYFDRVTVNTDADIMQHLDPLFSNNVLSQKFVYRGVNNASFRMYSSLQRQWIWNGLDDIFNNLPEYIKFIIKRARNDKFLMKNLCSDNDYNILAMVQHYLGSSALIDFSYDLRSAMFFTQDKMSKPAHDSSLNDYVSLYIIEHTHPILQGPTTVYQHGAINLQNMASQSGLNPNHINANSVLTSLTQMPYDIAFDGKLVHGGLKSLSQVSVPFFNFSGSSQISNANLAAQDGCFIQGSSDVEPLESLMLQQHKYLGCKIIKCFDIHKDMVKPICQRYNVPTNEDMIYPHKKAMKRVYNHVKGLDSNLFIRNLFHSRS